MTASLVGQETTFPAQGKEWRVARWDLQIWHEFQKWAKEQLPDPLREVYKSIDEISLKDAETIRRLTTADRAEEKRAAEEKREPVLMVPLFTPNSEFVLKKAVDKASSMIALDSDELKSLLKSAVGQAKLLQLLLTKHHKDEATLEKAIELYAEIGAEEMARIQKVASGQAKTSPKNG